MELDGIPLWPDNHVLVKQLSEHFARYIYLPRLADQSVLLEAIRKGVASLSWTTDTFALADSFDEQNKRYRNLQTGRNVSLDGSEAECVLVKPDIARKQIDAEQELIGAPLTSQPTGTSTQPDYRSGAATDSQPTSEGPRADSAILRRFRGSVDLDPHRVGRDAGQIGDEIISHLSGLVGAKVKVTLEIEAETEAGVPDNVVRTVTENSRTLKFTYHGFERE